MGILRTIKLLFIKNQNIFNATQEYNKHYKRDAFRETIGLKTLEKRR